MIGYDASSIGQINLCGWLVGKNSNNAERANRDRVLAE